MQFISADPKTTGLFILAGNGKKLWVWLNREKWTNRPGDSITIDKIPADSRELEVYGWDGFRRRVNVDGSSCTIVGLAERGVRFIQLYSGAGSKWDSHDNIEKKHAELCRSVDVPIAGLLTDLKRRNMLDDTLVVWGGEFGRTPMSEKGNGRDHNPSGFTMWMAGGGVKGGQAIGATDDLGLHAVEDRQHVHDLHASILHLLGLDNMALTYIYKGRPERPTVNEGRFCEKLVG